MDDFPSPNNQDQQAESTTICSTPLCTQHNSLHGSGCWPLNSLQSPMSDMAMLEYQWTQSPTASPPLNLVGGTPMFQYYATMPWPNLPVQLDCKSVTTENTKKRRSQKRKEQNRNAQRAFRERKEEHAKSLERKVEALSEELQRVRLAYKKLRQSQETGVPLDEAELEDQVEEKSGPTSPVHGQPDSLDGMVCFDLF